MTEQLPETTQLIWYCQHCRKSCKVQPPTEDPACCCTTPVPSLRPTTVTVLHTPKQRPMHALSDEEGRLRALSRKGTRVRITFEGEISDAWQWSSAAGSRGLGFVVTSPDGRTHTVDVQQPGLHIEAIYDDDPHSKQQ